ncbi:6-phosphogluconate dehydrogenase C-terminal domain-like protein [Artomyces pyxidatus]|uniref:6-phosphogluconate dehydrogenase C-terminal domain-like protein n=1 Tax=Artomyces pyxidatus TaxID=48021 RepID=A0ACB8SR26_9AGAM|nr:6-phosphogluconate dehydrogenase C-terminal domain-like protein [Artomyces pyxidatus]
MSPTIAIIAAGAMGSAVARKLTTAGCTVLTNLDGRSEATRRRALAAGMQDVPFAELPRRAGYFLSILPPSDAFQLALSYVAAFTVGGTTQPAGNHPIYVDCNAVNPQTAKTIGELFAGSGVRFVDAAIIGGPPRDGYDPTFYAAADPSDIVALDAFERLAEHGLKISILRGDGAGVGDASALKMSYAGISKGLTGLFATMILSAHAASPATSTALLNELHASQPLLLERLTRSIPDMLPKAYRWVGEMREISEFVGGPMGDVHRGMASVYERIERAVEEDGEDKHILERFVKDAKDVQQAGPST